MQETDRILRDAIAGKESPSVQYLIFDEDQVIHQFSGGYADIKSDRPVGNDTTYNLFSITKTFTALAVLQLAEKLHISIDEPVRKYVRGFPYDPAITIRQLLAHTAGIPNPIPISWIHVASEHDHFNRDAFFAKQFLKHPKTRSVPNEHFVYSNLGYIILGQFIEAVSEKRYEHYVSDQVIRPLNLPGHSLDFSIPDPNKHATGYQKKWSASYLLLGWMIDKKKFMRPAENGWVPFEFNYVNGAPYGGLIGTSGALVRYIRELLRPDSPLLSSAGKKLLFTEQFTIDGKATGMCLSWYTGSLNGKPFYTHAGGGGGYYVEMRIYPEQGLGSVLFFNRSGMRDERYLDKLDKYFL